MPLYPGTTVPSHPGYLSGSYYPSALCNSDSTLAVSAGRLYLSPHRIDEAVQLDRVVVRVTTGAAGNVKVGVYRRNADGSVTFIAENSADMSTAAAADLEGSFASNPVLAPGFYDFACCFSGTPTVQAPNTGIPNGATYVVGGASASAVDFSGGGRVVGRYAALAYVAGPTLFFPASIANASLTRDPFTSAPSMFWRKA